MPSDDLAFGGALLLSVVLAIGLVVSLVALFVTTTRLRRARRRVAALEAEVEFVQQPRTRQVAGRAMKVMVGTAAKFRDQGVSGLLMSSIDDLARWALEDRGEIARIAAKDGTVTIMFSDIEDSTSLNDQLGDTYWVRLLAEHDKLVRTEVRRHRGHIVKSQGDGFMIVFREPTEAVRAALDIQAAIDAGGGRALRRTPIRVRIGMHAGTTVARDGDYFGTNVAMAARVAAHAEGGQILVSSEVGYALADEFTLVEAFDVELKGLPGTHKLWAVSATAPAADV